MTNKLNSLATAEATIKLWAENLRSRGWTEEDLQWLETETRRQLALEVQKSVKEWN